MQLNLSQKLFNCDDVKEDFDGDRKVGDGICGMKMLKQNTREKSGKDQQKPLKKLKTVQKMN